MTVNYSGFLIAGIGFFLTRFTVTLAVTDDPFRFYVAGVVPLVLGLGLAAFGVALAVGDVEPDLVRTTARWCVLGTVGMLVLVGMTLVGAYGGGVSALVDATRSYLTNFVIGGSVGGTLTGLYAAHNRSQRRLLRQHANRLEVLNRLLRHEVLNSLTAINGFAAVRDEKPESARTVIQDRVRAIEETIEEVKYLTDTTPASASKESEIDLARSLEAGLAAVRERFPNATIEVTGPDGPQWVQANQRLHRVIEQLVENAVVYGDGPVRLQVSQEDANVRLSVTDDGPGLPSKQRRLLEEGTIGEFDDPSAGFGLNVVRLLVESYGGSIDTTASDDGTTVTVTLPRARTGRPSLHSTPTGTMALTVSPGRLSVTIGAALLAGGVMGVVAHLLGDAIPIIGALYGVESSLVGWITHEFHSVVFGVIFAGIVSIAPIPTRREAAGIVALGTVWGLVLSLVASGLVMPVWLRLVGVPTPIPDVTGLMVATHVLWGLVLGSLTAVGYRRITPRVSMSSPTRSVGL